MQPLRRLLARRHLATLIVACALAMRLLVPTGFMIDRSASGAPTLILCPAQNDLPAPAVHHDMAHMMPDGSMMTGHDAEHRNHNPGPDHPCAFAAAGLAVAMPASTPLPVLAPPPAFAALPGRAPVDPGRGLAAPPPPATGPPAFA